jgi:hypothetical protein
MRGLSAIVLGVRTNLSRASSLRVVIGHCIRIKKESTEWGIGPHNGLGFRNSTGNLPEFKLIRSIEGGLAHNDCTKYWIKNVYKI